MTKAALLILCAWIFISCSQTSEKEILERLNTVLLQRGLEIDSTFGPIITISPIQDKTEPLTVDINDLFDQKNQDSLSYKIEEKANLLKQWFTLPVWNDPQSIIIPYIQQINQNEETWIGHAKTKNYVIGFTHINTSTNKPTTIGKEELNTWKLTENEFINWSKEYLNKLYKENSALTKSAFQGWEVFQIKSSLERSSNALLFSSSFQKDAAEKLHYPFYAILGKDLPAYVFKKKEFGEYFNKNIKWNEGEYPHPIEMLEFSDTGISVISLKE